MLPSIFRDNLFDDMFDFDDFDKEFNRMMRPLYGKHAQNMMKTDVRETDNSYELDIDLPGFKKDEIKVELDNGYLSISAAKGLDKDEEKKDGKYQLKVGEATVVLGDKAQELLVGKGVGERKVTVGIRPEHIRFTQGSGDYILSGKVDVSEMMGSEVYLHVNAVGRDVVLRIPTTDLPAEHRAGIPYGTEINFAFRPDLIHLFDPETEKNLMY